MPYMVSFPVQFFGSNFYHLQCAKREGIDLVMLMRSGRQMVDRQWAGPELWNSQT